MKRKKIRQRLQKIITQLEVLMCEEKLADKRLFGEGATWPVTAVNDAIYSLTKVGDAIAGYRRTEDEYSAMASARMGLVEASTMDAAALPTKYKQVFPKKNKQAKEAPEVTESEETEIMPKKGKRNLSAKARKAIAQAQKKRWKEFHAKQQALAKTA